MCNNSMMNGTGEHIVLWTSYTAKGGSILITPWQSTAPDNERTFANPFVVPCAAVYDTW